MTLYRCEDSTASLTLLASSADAPCFGGEVAVVRSPVTGGSLMAVLIGGMARCERGEGGGWLGGQGLARWAQVGMQDGGSCIVSACSYVQR